MVIGITGEIGAGKTTLAKIFESWGAQLISGDEIGWELLEPDEPTYGLLLKKYGRDILSPKGRIDRRKLGRVVFSSAEETKEFDDVIHPELLRRLKERMAVAKEKSSLVIVDAALIVEWGIADEFDKLIVVIADVEERTERSKRSRKLSDQELRDRFRSQLPRGEKTKYADWVVENNGSLRELREEAERIRTELNRQRQMHS